MCVPPLPLPSLGGRRRVFFLLSGAVACCCSCLFDFLWFFGFDFAFLRVLVCFRALCLLLLASSVAWLGCCPRRLVVLAWGSVALLFGGWVVRRLPPWWGLLRRLPWGGRFSFIPLPLCVSWGFPPRSLACGGPFLLALLVLVSGVGLSFPPGPLSFCRGGGRPCLPFPPAVLAPARFSNRF